MDRIIRAARDVTDQEWEELKDLYVKAFTTMSKGLSATDLALMDNHPEQFWANVFDLDRPRSHAKNYIFTMIIIGKKIAAYGFYLYVNEVRYLYVHHFVVHPDFQGQGLGKRLMSILQELYVDAKKIGLLTRTYNVLAQNFYKHLGFSATIDIPNHIHEYYSTDRVYMERIT
jgi:ribosomal protein S18 acetylase RimI-like enzyme